MAQRVRSVLALDFDGVLCDSVDEMALSAWRAARPIWPEIFPVVPAADYVNEFRAVRHHLKTGYESMYLAWCVQRKVPIPTTRANYQQELADLMAANGMTRRDWVERFAGARDTWIATDQEAWVAQHRFYPGVVQAIRDYQRWGVAVFIVTTKESRYVRLLLDSQHLEIPDDRLFGLGQGMKTEVLQQLRRSEAPGSSAIHFVEDRLATLQEVADHPALHDVHLHLALWGYNTREEQTETQSSRRIRPLNLEEFPHILPSAGLVA